MSLRISSASEQKNFSVSVSICRKLLHLHRPIFPIQLLLNDCQWTFHSGLLSPLFAESIGLKEQSINLLGSLQLAKISISKLSKSVLISIKIRFLISIRIDERINKIIICINLSIRKGIIGALWFEILTENIFPQIK